MSTSASSTSSLSPSSVPSGAPQQASIAASAARCSSSVPIGRMSMVVSSELRHHQCIDTVILRMGADELHEGDLPTEIESGHQAIVSSCNLELTRSRTLAFGAAFWTSSVDAHCAALTSL